jgi:hypothetical protein
MRQRSGGRTRRLRPDGASLRRRSKNAIGQELDHRLHVRALDRGPHRCRVELELVERASVRALPFFSV